VPHAPRAGIDERAGASERAAKYSGAAAKNACPPRTVGRRAYAAGQFRAACTLRRPPAEAVMRTQYAIAALALGALLGTSQPLAAQSDPMDWRKGTALSVFGGAASATGGTNAAAGGAIGWELTPYLTFEAGGTWMPGGDLDAFAGLFGARVHLLSRRTAVPFVSGAIGVHHTTVALNDQAPMFYRRRMRFDMRDDQGRLKTTQTFDDAVYAFGAGVDVYLRRHLSLRPDLRVLLVHDGGTRAVALYGVHLAYHFEEHPITP
jgi:hypothetical protein